MKTDSLCLTVMMAAFVLSCAPKINSNIGIREVVKDRYYANIKTPEIRERKVQDRLTTFEEKSQIFNINPFKDTTIIGRKGTKVSIHANCLVREDGAEIAGPVKVELQELYSKADMILQNKPTISDGKLLESNGEIYLNASNNGEKLNISCKDGISVTLASPFRVDMDMWLGKINNAGNINWQLDSTMIQIGFNNNNDYIEENYNANDTNAMPKMLYSNSDDNFEVYDGGVNNFLFTTNKFGWINCDKFYSDSSEKVDMYVQMKNPFPKEYQTYLYVVFPDINSVLPLYSPDGENYTMPGLPSGKEVKIICVSATETKTFFDLKKVEIKKGLKETVELQPMAKSDIIKRLEEL